MKFVDRVEELERLRRLTAGDASAFAVVTGRRRVGKTRLLLEWSRRTDGVYTVADQSSPEIQRRYFQGELAVRFPALADVTFADWRALFRAVTREAGRVGWRGPLILDELPFLVASSPELPSVLQHVVDHDAKEIDLVLAVAGSSQTMMDGLVLDAEAPLYGRARELLHLRPLPAGYLSEGLAIRDAVSAVEAWAAWGGLPRYWELAQAWGADTDAAVDACVLDPSGVLHSEPDRLLSSEIPAATHLRPLLDAIGLGAHRPSEIGTRIGMPVTSLARSLARLVDMGLVRRDVPFDEDEKSSKRALYRLADPFLRLWWRLVGPYRSFLARATREQRLRHLRAQRSSLVAEAWEELCRAAVPHLGDALPWKRSFRPAGRYWHGQGPEWDLVSWSDDGETLLLGEAKWSERAFRSFEVERVLGSLRAKGVPPIGRPKNIVHVVFVPALRGSVNLGADAHALTADDVLAASRT